VFIPIPEEKYEDPLAKYFVLQNQLPAKCPATFKYTYKKGVFSKNCGTMGQKWEKVWSPAKQRVPGTKYGDEVCDILTKELDMPDVPNDVFPEGVQFGYFYNYCENEDWKDTAVRSKKFVCCQDGKYKSCEEIFGELEAGASEVSGTNGSSNYGGGGGNDSQRKGGSTSSSTAEAALKSEAARLDGLQNKLKNGEKLSKTEIQEMRAYIVGLRASAGYLLQTAADLGALLDKQ